MKQKLMVFVSLLFLSACAHAAKVEPPNSSSHNADQKSSADALPNSASTLVMSRDVVAKAGDTVISGDELDQASREDMRSLEHEIYEIKRKRLEALISERLFELEAKSRGISVNQLKQEIGAHLDSISEAESRSYFDQMQGCLGPSFSEARGRIQNLLLEQKRLTAEKLSVQKLKEKYQVQTFLEPPRLHVSTEQLPIRGNPAAPVTLIEFSDFQCPFCARAQTAIQEIRSRYPNEVRLIFKHFPLPMHSDARGAHLASLCAEEQGKFWEYRDRLFQNQRALKKADLLRYAEELGLTMEPFRSCLESGKYQSRIDQDLEEAFSLGVQGTPAFFINGRFLSGAQPFSEFEQVIEEELNATRKS